MFFYFNEDVEEAIVPQDEELVDEVISDLNVTMRLLGYTGRCPTSKLGDVYADKLTLLGSTYRYTNGDVQVEDTGFIYRRSVAPSATVNVSNMTGNKDPAAPTGLSFATNQASWQEVYITRSSHVISCVTPAPP